MTKSVAVSMLAASMGLGCLAERPATKCKTKFLAEIPLSTTYACGNMWTGWSGRWADNLLLVNRSAGYLTNNYYRVTTDSMLTTLKEMQSYKLDGADFNCDRPALLNNMEEAQTREGMPGLFVGSLQPRSFNPELYDFERSMKAFARNFQNPYAWYGEDGRQIFISYWTDRHHQPAALKEWLTMMREKFGDFRFVPDLSALPKTAWRERWYRGERAAVSVEIKEYIRGYLRVADGIYCGEYIACQRMQDGEKVFNEEYWGVLLGIIREVFEEPEFKGKKLLGLVAGVGHGNPTTFGNTIGQDGTRTLRNSFRLAMALQPDFINFFEWDEWNENTLIKPSIWNSFANRRLFRSLISEARGEPNEPLPGDDLTIPNLILSYRKTMVPGERAIFELLTLPEPEAHGEVLAALRLKNEFGQVVKAFEPCKLKLDRMDEVRLEGAAEDWAGETALVPELALVGPAGKRIFKAGLPHIEVQPGGSFDHKWALMTPRDLAAAASCELQVVPTAEAGVYRAEIDAKSAEEIDRVEVAVNGNLVYSKGGEADDFRMTEKDAVFSVLAVVRKYTDRGPVKSNWPTLSVSGVTSAAWRIGGKTINELSATFYDQSNYTPEMFLRLRPEEVDKAVVKLTWPAIGEERQVALAEVLAADGWATTGAGGFVFAVSRYYGFNEYGPSGAQTPSLSTAALIRPDKRVSVVSAYLVTKSGKLFRSLPVTVGELGEAERRRCWSATKRAPVEVTIAANRQPPLVYDFSCRSGDIVKSGAGAMFDGVLGTVSFVATHRNRNGATFYHACPEDFSGKPSRAPVRVGVNGETALRFDGTGTYFAIPAGAITRFGAFKLSFDVRVDDPEREQQLFATGTTSQYGAIGKLFTRKGGELSAFVCGFHDDDTMVDSGVRLKAGEWAHVELAWNVDTAELTVNGRSSGKVKCVAPLRYDAGSWIGGRKGEYFKGLVKNVRIDYNDR